MCAVAWTNINQLLNEYVIIEWWTNMMSVVLLFNAF